MATFIMLVLSEKMNIDIATTNNTPYFFMSILPVMFVSHLGLSPITPFHKTTACVNLSKCHLNRGYACYDRRLFKAVRKGKPPELVFPLLGFTKGFSVSLRGTKRRSNLA